jgi:hypothetical protein
MNLHPNKAPFIGILTLVDTPSDNPPSGGHGHRVILTTHAASMAIDSIIGMGINVHADGSGHNVSNKVGIIDTAEIKGNEIIVSGYLFCRDFPAVIRQLSASADYGMSYELTDAHVEDMLAEVWKLTRVTFTGAAILLKNKAAYRLTDFVLI